MKPKEHGGGTKLLSLMRVACSKVPMLSKVDVFPPELSDLAAHQCYELWEQP